MLGAEINMACITHSEYDIELPSGETGTLYESEGMWGMMIGSRFNFMGNAAFRSYTEVRAGFNTFSTTISSCDEDLSAYNDEQEHGTSFLSSIGVGFVLDPKALLKGETGKTWIAVRGAYVAGTNVDYRNAPESGTLAPLNDHLYNSSLGYFDLGISASWQLR